jgi:hypothetical protein
MGRTKAVLAVLAWVLLPGLAAAAYAQRFDGSWQTTISCPAARDALGYSFRFTSVVKDGILRGQHGTAGETPFLQIEGPIGADGTARLYATGRTGSKEMVPGRDTPRGTGYGYNIDAHFEGSSGAGSRVEGRPCSFQFVRQ